MGKISAAEKCVPSRRKILRTILSGLMLFAAAPCRADDTALVSDGFIAAWLAMVGRTQDEQPHWITPLATGTPRLEQEFRLDMFSEALPNHEHLDNYGAAKGLDLVLAENVQITLGIPAYEARRSNTGKTLADGWGDWPALLVKYRFLSANEEQGNYIVTGFLQLSAPTGNATFTNHFYVVQPTVAFGKGWSDFDVQATVSEQFATGATSIAQRNFGQPVLVNVTAQYHLLDFFWPELEANSTWWPSGSKEGKTQLFLTPGIIFGRFMLHDRVRLIFGAGYQLSVSPSAPAYRHNMILTLRSTF
jgi:hypothetical protein